MRVTQSERTTRPAQPLMPVDDGRVDSSKWRHRLHIIGAVLVSAVFFLGSILAGPKGYETGADLPSWRFVLMSACMIGGTMAGAYGVLYFVLDLWGAVSYQLFLGKYRQVELATRLATNNQEVDEVVTAWELDTTNPRDLIVAVIAMQLAVNHNTRAPWAHRNLTEQGLWFDRRKLAEVSDSQARQLPEILSSMGYIEGRSGAERQAGQWVVTPLPRSYSNISDVAEHYGISPDDVHRHIAMGVSVDKLRRGIGKVM